jgi:hypothetical protein
LIALVLSNVLTWCLGLLCDTFPADSGGIAAFCLLFQPEMKAPNTAYYLARRFNRNETANVFKGEYIGIAGRK